MTAVQLRAELFREMNPLLDSEVALAKVLAFVRNLTPVKKEMEQTASKSYKVMPVSPTVKKWSGSVTFTDEEIHPSPQPSQIKAPR